MILSGITKRQIVVETFESTNNKGIIEYDGKGFNGWQKQPNKLNIQGEIEQAIKQITGEEVDLTASRKN